MCATVMSPNGWSWDEAVSVGQQREISLAQPLHRVTPGSLPSPSIDHRKLNMLLEERVRKPVWHWDPALGEPSALSLLHVSQQRVLVTSVVRQ